MATAYILARPSNEIQKLEDAKNTAMAELAKIKSVQLEFVKHSLLSRKIIKAEKQVHTQSHSQSHAITHNHTLSHSQ